MVSNRSEELIPSPVLVPITAIRMLEVSDPKQEPVCVRLHSDMSTLIVCVRSISRVSDLLSLSDLLLQFGFQVQTLHQIVSKQNLTTAC